MGHFSLYPKNFFRLAYFHSPMNQMIPTMSHIIVTHEEIFFSWHKQHYIHKLTTNEDKLYGGSLNNILESIKINFSNTDFVEIINY